MGISYEMCVIDGWKNAPAAIDLGIVPIDFGDYQEDRCQE